MVAKVARAVGRGLGGDRSLAGIAVGALGLTFKAGTDDLRESPSLAILDELVAAGATVTAYDPTTVGQLDRVQRERLQGLRLADTALGAAESADVVVILTEWREFKELDLAGISSAMRGAAVVDTRNVLDPAAVRAAGLDYQGVGRR